MKIWQLIIAGVIVHVVLFYSIFDIYFTSPLVHGMTPVSSLSPPPAKRLVLFVADGLRADKFFELDENKRNRAPFLRKVIEELGVWGVSHTRVPTESRPGHVALIAGFYEDVSSVTKGWKENPVEFDSVFNESRHTWSWGSPDILPMFAKGASGDHVTISCYPSDLEDFAGSDMTKLDTWVFDQFKNFLDLAQSNMTLRQDLQVDKLIFFLHLLAIDTHGHSNKPHSREYLDNIKLVDAGIQKVMGQIENFYGHDGQTSYIMTADHGMTDWGSHGAGHAHETLTPFVAWGAGVSQPIPVSECGVHTDSLCADWHLTSFKRRDMEQADVAPLMAYLVGIPFPVNSVGILPVDVLSVSDGDKAEALLANAQQILAQFKVKMDQIKARTISTTFRAFLELPDPHALNDVKHIRQLIHSGQYQDAMKESKLLIEKGLRGLQYYQTYDRTFLGISVVLAFCGWMLYVLQLLLLEHTTLGQCQTTQLAPNRHLRLGLFAALATTVVILLAVQSLPVMCYLYCLLPVFLWFHASHRFDLLVQGLRAAYDAGIATRLCLSLMVSAAGLEIIVLSFYHRQLLSLGLLAMSAWPLIRSQEFKATRTVVLGWSLSCLLVAVFPLMPVVGRDTRYGLVISSGMLAVLGGSVWVSRSLQIFTGKKYLIVVQFLLISLSVIIVWATSSSIARKEGLPWLCQIGSWTVLGLSGVLPMLSSTKLLYRLTSLSLSFLALYLLLSITYEGFFVLSLLVLLYFWLCMEQEEHTGGRASQHMGQSGNQSLAYVDFAQEGLVKDNIPYATFSRPLELSDLRRAYFFIFFILTAFFGTGNIASINSFDPASVYCFLTVFSPFLMGALLMLKNMLPFLLVTCAFRGVHVLTQTPLRSLFLMVLLMSDFMALHFFFLVRDSGSWLDIGTTISHYVIVMAMNIFLLLLTGLSHGLTCWHLPVSRQPRKLH